MSSKFSVKNFSKDQETMNNVVVALRDYMIIGIFWSIGTCLIFYANYGVKGLTLNIICNAAIIMWIYFSYYKAFSDAAKKYDLKIPNLFEA